MSDVGLSANLEVNADGVQSGVNKSITSLEALQNEIVKVQDQLAKASDDPSFNKLAAKYNNLSKNVEILSKGNIKIAPIDLKPLNDTNDAITKVGTNTANLSNIMNRNLHGVADLFIAPGRAALIFANDLPQLISRFQELKAAQAEIAEEGGIAKTSTQLLGEAFNPLGLAISVASVALIELVPKLVDYIKKGKEAASATDVLNEALEKDSSYKDAIQNVAKLTEDIKLAKEGFLSKTAVVKEYNDTIGKSTGQVNNLSQAESALIKNKDAYLQMMLQKAAATVALSKYSEQAVKVQEDMLNMGNSPSIGDFFKNILSGTAGIGTAGILQNRIDDLTKAQDLQKKYLDLYNKFESDAATTASKNGFNLFGTDGDKTAKTQADKISDAITEIQRKQESLNNAFSKGSITNVQYYSQSIDLLTKSIENLHDKYNLPFDGKILSSLQEQLDKLRAAAPVNLTALKGDSGDIKTIANYMAHIYDEANKEAVKQYKSASKVSLSDLIQPQLDSFTAVESITKKLSGQKAAIDMTYAVNSKLELDEASKKLSADTQAISELIQKHITGEISDKDYNATIKNLKIQYDTDSISAQVESVNKKLNSMLQGLADSSIEALGTALGSGDFSGLFDGILSSLGDAVEKFGEEMLALSIQANLLTDTLLDFFMTPAGIAAAAGIIAIGAAIKAAAKKGTKSTSTSTGNYVTASSPSYYTPSQTSNGSSSAASAFSGGSNVAANVGSSVAANLPTQGGGFVAETKIKGSDLLLAIKRTDNNKNR